MGLLQSQVSREMRSPQKVTYRSVCQHWETAPVFAGRVVLDTSLGESGLEARIGVFPTVT